MKMYTPMLFLIVPLLLFSFKKKRFLAGVAQWVELQPANQKAAGLIPSQGTCLGGRRARGSQLMFLSLPLSLKSNIKRKINFKEET